MESKNGFSPAALFLEVHPPQKEPKPKWGAKWYKSLGPGVLKTSKKPWGL
jgi:hypothetical protein